ncbi:hypothetical protein CN318_29780 [Bacillus cereus]|nr:hypothetical protein CN318_29780 [Bacillus cereus]PFQ61210.1 hypothetical protein COK21_27805 [Bacillus cereus]
MANTDTEKDTEKDIGARFLTWIGIILIPIAILMPWVVVHFDLSSLGEFGTVGDFIGGTTVTFLTGASVFLLIATNIMQRKELQMSRQSIDEMVKQTKASIKQAEEAKKETQITNQTMKKQQFETTFFNMLQLHHQIVENIQLRTKHEDLRGRKAIEEIKKIFVNSLGEKQYFVENPEKGRADWLGDFEMRISFLRKFFGTPNGISKEMLNEVYKEFHNEYGNAIGHYMRNNYRIVKFIVENVVDNEEEAKGDKIFGDKRFYFGTLRAQWSNAEFELILINSLYERNSKFKNLIKEHDVLDIQETDAEKLKGKSEGSFILKDDTPIPVAYNHLIENDSIKSRV